MMSIENNKKKKQIAILGSTGSIGTQALQVIEEHPDLYEPYALTANNRVEIPAGSRCDCQRSKVCRTEGSIERPAY